MGPMLIQFEGDGALHQRLYRGLRAAILDGRLPPRVRLPSTRSLAGEMRVSRNVVMAAFAQLLGEGYIEGRVGSGTYVAATLPDSAVTPCQNGTSTPARRIETSASIMSCRSSIQPFSPAAFNMLYSPLT